MSTNDLFVSIGHNSNCLQKSHLATQDIRSQSLPDCSYEENYVNGNLDIKICDNNIKEKDSNIVSGDFWFKTWPERYDKNIKSKESSPVNSQSNIKLRNIYNSNNKNCDNDNETCNNGISLNEALQNISLAYSPVTKQLHYVDTPQYSKRDAVDEVDYVECKDLDSNFLSTTEENITSKFIDNAERKFCNGHANCNFEPQLKNKTNFSTFFTRNVFTWKSFDSDRSFGKNVLKWFGKKPHSYLPSVASSSALIQNKRPPTVPPKSFEEEQRHREEYKAILLEAKRRDEQFSLAKQKQQNFQLKQEEQQAATTKHFVEQVLPNWEAMKTNKKTKDLWWQGLPSSVRGKVWSLAIGNDLNLTHQLYEICLQRAQEQLSSLKMSMISQSNDDDDLNRENSMDLIQLDISRTFPYLCIFQEGGPYSDILHSLLAAYVCYRPDVGYVQGMSYIAAILILNMERLTAFICFANLLNQPLHLSAFTLNQRQMKAYYDAYNEVFNYNLPKLFEHFRDSGLTPDLYLIDWIYTIYAKAMPLDVACRIWDVFLRDGYEFIFRTALGILNLHQPLLLEMDFLHGAQFLTKLPDTISPDQLFKSIQVISTNIGKESFSQIVDRYVNNNAMPCQELR